MKFIVSLAATAVLGAAVAAPGLQDSRESGARPLTPVGAAEGAGEETKAPVRPFLQDAGHGPAEAPTSGVGLEEGIRQRLTGRDLDLRMKAFQDVAEQAAVSAEARRARGHRRRHRGPRPRLQRSTGAPRSGSNRGPGRAGSAFGGRGLQAPTDPFEAMRRQLDSVFGADPLLDSVLRNDPLLRRGFGADPFSGEDPFEAMRSRVERMREEMEALQRQGVRSMGPGGWATRSSSTSIQQTGDGVRVEITEDEGDGPETRVFEGLPSRSSSALIRSWRAASGSGQRRPGCRTSSHSGRDDPDRAGKTRRTARIHPMSRSWISTDGSPTPA